MKKYYSISLIFFITVVIFQNCSSQDWKVKRVSQGSQPGSDLVFGSSSFYVKSDTSQVCGVSEGALKCAGAPVRKYDFAKSEWTYPAGVWGEFQPYFPSGVSFLAFSGMNNYSQQCAVVGGALYCWGNDVDGLLNPNHLFYDASGNEIKDNSYVEYLQPTRVPGTPDNVKEVVFGFGFGCLIDMDKDLYCWGRFVNYFTGLPTNAPQSETTMAKIESGVDHIFPFTDRICMLKGHELVCSGVDSKNAQVWESVVLPASAEISQAFYSRVDAGLVVLDTVGNVFLVSYHWEELPAGGKSFLPGPLQVKEWSPVKFKKLLGQSEGSGGFCAINVNNEVYCTGYLWDQIQTSCVLNTPCKTPQKMDFEFLGGREEVLFIDNNSYCFERDMKQYCVGRDYYKKFGINSEENFGVFDSPVEVNFK